MKHLSLAGRTTLIKSVALAIPSYVMQVFLLTVSICNKMDRLMRHFLWGTKDDEKRFLSLRAWNNVCTPKMASGLGIRRSRDMNTKYITKLGWQICTEPQRTWVKLIRSKYLRGRRVTKFQKTTSASTWIWNGITSCRDSLFNGLCY